MEFKTDGDKINAYSSEVRMRGAELVSARRSDSEGEELLRNALRNWFTAARSRGLSYSSEDGLRKVAVGEIRSYLTINTKPESWSRTWKASVRLPDMDSTSLATAVDKMSKAQEVKKDDRSEIRRLQAKIDRIEMGFNPRGRIPPIERGIEELQEHTAKAVDGVLEFLLALRVR